jgi:hypothetical protein
MGAKISFQSSVSETDVQFNENQSQKRFTKQYYHFLNRKSLFHLKSQVPKLFSYYATALAKYGNDVEHDKERRNHAFHVSPSVASVGERDLLSNFTALLQNVTGTIVPPTPLSSSVKLSEVNS